MLQQSSQYANKNDHDSGTVGRGYHREGEFRQENNYFIVHLWEATVFGGVSLMHILL